MASSISDIENNTTILYHNNIDICSGEFLRRNNITYYVTANHCHEVKDDQYSIVVKQFNPDEKLMKQIIYPLDFVMMDDVHDISIFTVRDPSFIASGVDIASTMEIKLNLKKGSTVIVAGFPDSNSAPMQDLVYTDGLYVGEDLAWDPTIKKLGGKFYRTTAPVFYGNSGGGLYIKIGEDYKLIGVTSQLDPENKAAASEFGELSYILGEL